MSSLEIVRPSSPPCIPVLKDLLFARCFSVHCSWNLIGYLIPSHKSVPLEGTESRSKETSSLRQNSKGVSNKTKRGSYAKNTWSTFIYRLWWSAERSLLVSERLDDVDDDSYHRAGMSWTWLGPKIAFSYLFSLYFRYPLRRAIEDVSDGYELWLWRDPWWLLSSLVPNPC